MEASTDAAIWEQAKRIPVFRKCDVLVVGGGPAGCAAAAAAAKLGADTILVERYGHLGGMSSGGMVLFIDRMSDWEGRQVIAGFADDVLSRLPAEAILGPARDIWGSHDPQQVAYWDERQSAYQGTVTWSPMVDPEMLKIAYNDLLVEGGVKLLLHAWAVAPVQDGNTVRGVVFESKSGRQAILAQVVVDATGDGDIFALAGGAFEIDIEEGDIHHKMNVAFRLGGVDLEQYRKFRRERREEWQSITPRLAHELGIPLSHFDLPYALPRAGMVLFMGPRLAGYSCINVEHLTAVELESRRVMLKLLAFYRRNVPGFADAYVLDTAPQLGTRHSRRLVGVKKTTRAEWLAGKIYEDEIGLCPPPNPRQPNASIPLGCLIPVDIENLLAAGRNFSCDPATHVFLREVPVCWVMGQAAGVAAAMAADSGARVRDLDAQAVQRHLLKQGVYLRGQSTTTHAVELSRRE